MGIRWIFQLRVGLSPLKSHKKAHKFQDTPNDKCLWNFPETTLHVLWKCTIHNEFRPILFQTLHPILLLNDMTNLSDSEIVHILLYGHEKFIFYENRAILKATINFIQRSSRFSPNLTDAGG